MPPIKLWMNFSIIVYKRYLIVWYEDASYLQLSSSYIIVLHVVDYNLVFNPIYSYFVQL